MNIIIKRFKHFAHRIFRSFGYDFLPYTPDHFVSLRRRKILEEEDIDLVLDIGANEGDYVAKLRAGGYTGRIISFEPLSRPFSVLEQRVKDDSQWECENTAVGDTDGDIEINLSGHETSSSILPIAHHHLRAMPSSAIVAKERTKITKLDSFLRKIILPAQRVYLKADVQGYEKQVLQGALQLLKQTRAIELELSLVPMYDSSPILMEMLNYLEGFGFMLVSIENVFSDPDSYHMLQVDGIFVKSQSVT